MPTALGPALAVAALLPLAAPRPYDHGSAFASTTNFRSDIAITGSGIVSCIDDNTRLIDTLSECLQYDGSFEENVISGTHVSFGLLDEDWQQLQLLHQANLRDDSFLKEKLILAFRTLLASFYQTHGAKWVGSKEERHDKVDEYTSSNTTTYSDSNTSSNTINLGAARTDEYTKMSTPLVVVNLGNASTITHMGSTTPPTSTVKMVSDGDISNEIYEEAGSDPRVSVVQPPVYGNSKDEILSTDGPYRISDATIDKGSYGTEGSEITYAFYEQEVTTSEINRISKDFRDLVDSKFSVWSTARLDLQGAESDGPNNEFPFTTNGVTVPGKKLIEPTDVPYNEVNIEKSEGRGTDIDENELFPPPSAEAEENEIRTIPNVNPAADDVKINIAYSTSTADYRTSGILTDNSHHRSLNNESTSNGLDAEDYDDQNSQATDDPMKQYVISSAPTTLVVAIVTPSSDLDIEGKENESGYEETSGTPRNSQQESKGFSVDDPLPIGPITYPAERELVSIPHTTSNVEADISKTGQKEGNEKDFDIEVSLDPVSLDLPQDSRDQSLEISVSTVETTPPANPNPISDSEMDLSKLDIDISENSLEINRPTISNIDSTSGKTKTLATETNRNSHEDGKIRFDLISTQPSESQYTDQSIHKTEGNSNTNDPSVNNESDLKHLDSSEISTPFHQKGTTPLPPSDFEQDNTNYVHQTEKSLIYTTSNNLISEETKSPRDLIDLTISGLPIEVTHNVIKDISYSPETTEGISEFTVPLVNVITSEEPELRGQTEQKTPIIQSIPLEGTTPALQPESDSELDGYSNEPDDRIYQYTSSVPDPDISLHPAPDPVSPFPQSKDDDISSVSESKSDENPTTLSPDNDRSNTENTDFVKHNTDGNIPPITANNSTWDFNRENITELKTELHSFSIPLPEVPKAKQGNMVLNTLRIFPPSNNHILISQPTYKSGCLSLNDCVRVGNSLISKQRRTPTVNLDSDGEEDLQFSGVDKDSVLWWHKMRALKKKSR